MRMREGQKCRRNKNLAPRGGGGGGAHPKFGYGMCCGKVKNGQGLRNELPVERENAGLRNEFEPF